MMHNREKLAQAAVVKALQMCTRAGYSVRDPLSVYDLAERLGIEVRFVDIPSMEGIYKGPRDPTILLSSLRPPGRPSYNCSHELGHHELGHGAQFDELIDERSKDRRFDPKEFQADCFAGALLMPQMAVRRGFSIRGWDPATSSPESLYTIAGWFGVGYGTLIHHLWKALNMLATRRAEALLRQQPKDIRATLLGRECRENLIIADCHWDSRAIDVQVTDLISLPPNVHLEGKCVALLEQGEKRTMARAVTPGIGRVAAERSESSAYIRVSRQQFVGGAQYRFEEEVEDAEQCLHPDEP
jgi:Zn-dependent peptidase ImmA (M78 family)